MGISRDSAHKRRLTGGRVNRIRSKRKFEMGRQPANTRLGDRKVTQVRVRGGNFKFRALRLDAGNFCWPGEAVTRKTRILKVVYNSSSNELVRTNTLVKSCIVQIDSTPFKAWYSKFYGVQLGKSKEEESAAQAHADAKDAAKDAAKPASSKTADAKKVVKGKGKKGAKAEEDATKKPAEASKEPAVASQRTKHKQEKRGTTRTLENALNEQFKTGRLYARITSRPGQVGRADGVILEGEELAFYLRKIVQKKKK